MVIGLAGIAAALAGIGACQALLGWFCVARFASIRSPRSMNRAAATFRRVNRMLRLRTTYRPSLMGGTGRSMQSGACEAITVLKPLHGDEPLLEEGLTTFCVQDYPADCQIVFGVQRPTDPAIAVVRRLQARFPNCDIALVQDPTLHGENRKVGNLINMLPAAKHDLLVIADSDLHVRHDYLRRLAAAIEQPEVGLATTLYAALPANAVLPAWLGATQITHGFLPGALLARAMDRQDCLGATMCLRRETLVRIGGLNSLVDHLADDNVLGRRVAALGLKVALADTVPATTVPETTLAALFRHELRWARTIRALEPVGFAASVLQYPLFWAALALALSGGASWGIATFVLVWLVRALAGIGIDRALAPKLAGTPQGRRRWGMPRAGLTSGGARNRDDARISREGRYIAFRCPVWLLPVRDLLSVAVMVTSYGGTRVDWRGHTLQADGPPTTVPSPPPFRPVEELTLR